MDLTPRSTTETTTPVAPVRQRRKWGPWLVLGAVVLGGGVVVTKFLTSAIDYYCNADEVGVKSQCSGDRRLRVQGTVGDVVEAAGGGIETFVVKFGSAAVMVDYTNGAIVPDLFQDCIPVVVAGRWNGTRLIGSSVEVKHSNEYVAENGQRIETEKAACTQVAA